MKVLACLLVLVFLSACEKSTSDLESKSTTESDSKKDRIAEYITDKLNNDMSAQSHDFGNSGRISYKFSSDKCSLKVTNPESSTSVTMPLDKVNIYNKAAFINTGDFADGLGIRFECKASTNQCLTWRSPQEIFTGSYFTDGSVDQQLRKKVTTALNDLQNICSGSDELY